jgi:hypothetical protein
VLSDTGLHVVRRVGNDIRATLFHLDGSMAYDLTLFQSPAGQFAEPMVSVVFDGTSHVIAYGERPPGNMLQPESIKILTISPSGAHESPRTIVQVVRPDAVSTFRLAWNGAEHLLVWNMATGTYALRVSPALLPIDTEPRRLPIGRFGANITALPDGTFVVSGEDAHPSPSVMLLRRNGELTEPVAIDPGSRRRGARK